MVPGFPYQSFCNLSSGLYVYTSFSRHVLESYGTSLRYFDLTLMNRERSWESLAFVSQKRRTASSCQLRLRKTTDHLFDAPAFGKNDCMSGLSESIIMANPAGNCGTSIYVSRLFDEDAFSHLLVRPALVSTAPSVSKPRKLLFEDSLE